MSKEQTRGRKAGSKLYTQVSVENLYKSLPKDFLVCIQTKQLQNAFGTQGMAGIINGTAVTAEQE